MIKSLRRKFILITMMSVILVLSSIMTTINIFNYNDIMKASDAKLTVLSMYDGSFGTNAPSTPSTGDGSTQTPPDNDDFKKKNGINEETPFNTRYFTVTFDSNGTVTTVNVDHIAAISFSEASYMAKDLFASSSESGFLGDYKYITTTVKDSDGNKCTMYIFLDCSNDLNNFRSFLYASIGVSALGAALVFLLVLFLSRLAVRPMAESYEKQKRFITDASHEIKTPLAIIDANTEVIELENGESEWTISTKRQIKRLSSLTEKLVFLSRMDEEGSHLSISDFSMSEIVSETVDSFSSVAEAKGKVLRFDIKPDISYRGDISMIQQMVSLLVDNALKYSNEGGEISVSLQESGKSRILKVYNTVTPGSLTPGNLDMLVERFYRNDTSRNSKTGGHGIGLSVVQAIVHAHKGKIHAESKDGNSILFTAVL